MTRTARIALILLLLAVPIVAGGAPSPKTKWEARIYEFREIIASDKGCRTFFRLLRDKHPAAFAELTTYLDARWDERVAKEQAEVPPPMDEITDEGDIEEPEEPEP